MQRNAFLRGDVHVHRAPSNTTTSAVHLASKVGERARKRCPMCATSWAHVQLLGDLPQLKAGDHLHPQAMANGRDDSESPDQELVWQQRVRSPSHRILTAPNPDSFDQQ